MRSLVSPAQEHHNQPFRVSRIGGASNAAVSFGGFPSVLSDVHKLVTANGWLTDREFADIFAVSQVVPGPNMILMMSFVGLKVGGLPGAITSAVGTFGPPCLLYYGAYRLWDRFRDRPWQQVVRRGLAPLTIGLVIAGGYVMARTGDVGWQSTLVTAAAVGLKLATRLNPLWILVTGGVLGGLGFLQPFARRPTSPKQRTPMLLASEDIE